MSDYLMRSAAPISAELWAKIDEMVVTVIKKTLVGRRIVELVGPLGWGVEMVPLFGFTTEGGAATIAENTKYIALTELRQEFVLKAKQLAIAEGTPFGLDLGAVAIAATKLAKAEDDLVLGGLLKQAKTTSELGDWSVLGGASQAVAMATAKLLAAGFDGPYALVMSPGRYARLSSLIQQGQREVEAVEELAEAGLFQWTGMADDLAMVISPHPWNMDLVVGQDVVTAYVGNEGIDQRFRIFETLALRVKLSGAVCVLK